VRIHPARLDQEQVHGHPRDLYRGDKAVDYSPVAAVTGGGARGRQAPQRGHRQRLLQSLPSAGLRVRFSREHASQGVAAVPVLALSRGGHEAVEPLGQGRHLVGGNDSAGVHAGIQSPAGGYGRRASHVPTVQAGGDSPQIGQLHGAGLAPQKQGDTMGTLC